VHQRPPHGRWSETCGGLYIQRYPASVGCCDRIIYRTAADCGHTQVEDSMYIYDTARCCQHYSLSCQKPPQISPGCAAPSPARRAAAVVTSARAPVRGRSSRARRARSDKKLEFDSIKKLNFIFVDVCRSWVVSLSGRPFDTGFRTCVPRRTVGVHACAHVQRPTYNWWSVLCTYGFLTVIRWSTSPIENKVDR